jgi:anti-sigma factor ChrR (cupin superfamily)
MTTTQQEEQASLYVLGAQTPLEKQAFEAELCDNAEVRDLVRSFQAVAGALAMAAPAVILPPDLKDKVLQRIAFTDKVKVGAGALPKTTAAVLAGHRFLEADDPSGWKQLPVPGAWIKLLSLERERGYAVLLGKLEAGVRYPAHTNAGPEDFYVLTGDLHIGERALRAGDFHHADAGSLHGENFSVQGCTLLAVLTTDDPLVAFAMA